MRVHRVIRALAMTIGLAAYAHDGRAVIVCPDRASDERSLARDEAWRQYYDSVQQALSGSSDPRDRALAAFAGDFSSDERVRAEALARSAADAAADDMLVQWVALRRSQVASGNYEPMLSRLEQHEPDNAAVWLEVLVRAIYLQDRATADEALTRMAQGSRFDAHLMDLSKALSQAFERFPDYPKEPFDKATTYAQSMRSAYVDRLVANSLPALEPLFAMCRTDPDSGANLDRASACASVEDLLAASDISASAGEIGKVSLGNDQPTR